MATEVCLLSKVDTTVVTTNSTLRTVGSDNAKKNSTTNITTKATASRVTPSLKRATKFGEDTKATNMKNYEGVTRTNDLKGVGSTTQVAQIPAGQVQV